MSALAGRTARQRIARSAQAEWSPGPQRADPVALLRAQDHRRVPGLIPIRYGRMLASPFAFFRGAAAVMAADLGAGPDSGLRVQLCGDAHLSNFGVFQAPDRRLVFDVNDFDETLPGPFEWDVKRLAASFVVAARDRGFRPAHGRAAARAAVHAYRTAMAELVGLSELDVWYARLDVAEMQKRWSSSASAGDRRRLDANLARARGRDSLRALAKLTVRDEGELRIASRPPLLFPIRELAAREGIAPGPLAQSLQRLLAEYRATLSDQADAIMARYHFVDAAHKVVGVGSVGNRAWIALMIGRDEDDPLFLQLKEAGPSVLEPYAGAGRLRHNGHRVVAGQRLIQATGDILLGWLTTGRTVGDPRHFYVRQLWDGKGSANVDSMRPRVMVDYAELCGWCLARGHARTGDRVAITAYLGRGEGFDRAVADFAEAYADQNAADYARLQEAERSGEIEVQRGV